MKIQIDLSFLPSLNRITKYLILADLFLIFGWGLISPIFAVFLIEGIASWPRFIG
jgi:hypothetical protein